MEKEIDQNYPWEHITDEEIRIAALNLTGSQEQLPPMFSAVKVKGRRAYKYARSEQELVIPLRQIHISMFEITSNRLPK